MNKEKFRCGCCDLWFDTIEAYRRHAKTEKHKEVATMALIKARELGIFLNFSVEENWLETPNGREE